MRWILAITHAQQIAADRQEIGKLEGAGATESTHLVESQRHINSRPLRAYPKGCSASNSLILLSNQVGFGSEHGIDSIGSYWVYCNASNAFVQKCPLCTTDLSHVTVFGIAETLISSWPYRSGEQAASIAVRRCRI
jgi:hypothetical protein